MTSDPVILIPLRAPGEGKSRLAATLDQAHRAALSAAMFADVLAAVRAADLEVYVLASGPAASAAAAALSAAVIDDPSDSTGLNDSVAFACRELGHDREVAIVMGDLPRLTANHVRAVVENPARVVIAPTEDGGTGILMRRPASAMPTRYGPASAQAHDELATAHGLAISVVELGAAARDVDTAGDLAQLHTNQETLGPATRALIQGAAWTRLKPPASV